VAESREKVHGWCIPRLECRNNSSRGIYCSHVVLKIITTSSSQVEEFGRDVYKLVKTFTQKAKQANKSRDIGGGVMQPIHGIYSL